jgi:hypothetical protein
MTQPRKPIGELRKELAKMLIDIHVRPSHVKKREDLEQMIGMYGKFAEEKKTTPLPERSKGGRPKAKEVESSADEMGISIPKKVVKEKTVYAEKKEKKAKKPAAPALVEDEDSGTGSESEAEERKAKKAAVAEKPKRVLTEEQKAAMRAGREKKKATAGAGGEPKPEKAEPKKDVPPPDAPARDVGYNKLPVRKLD